MDENKIIPYIEPIFRFCCKRLSDRYDAEDLASEIICHILDGMNKYQIESLDAWVWRIAHNRYARFIDARNKNQIVLSCEDELFDIADYSDVYEDNTQEQYETVFRYLHTLSSEYKNIFVDYYIGELSVRSLAKKYSLPETTIKWRLNAGRQKIRDRIGEDKMDKVYRRINWNTEMCNGNMDANKYLFSQIARAICLAAYEKPLTVEEISICTGIPTMYIEDELPRLEYGDAVRKVGNKYATNFIVFSLKNRKQTEDVSASVVKALADKFEVILKEAEDKISEIDFYGNDFGIDRLGYIVVPYLLRQKVRDVKNNRLKLKNGPYPPRKDGGYGWFIVEETVDESENCAEYNSGCNVAVDDSGSAYKVSSHIYYYWISKYFDYSVYHNKGIRWMCANGIPQNSVNGVVAKAALSEEDAADLIKSNLLIKSEICFHLNFPHFTAEQFSKFVSLFEMTDEKINDLLAEWIVTVRNNFENFVPKHLHDQINQWVSCYLHQIIGYVTDELIRRGILRKPDNEKPLTNGVFSVEGKYINP
ncbi:MAG: sigma-70 family RNA polymerase sigma factor [Clostridia bacterium]|nr:sigma-70 family RNA polymerase sigma factor [Clostridia bacterium]